ncbi:hypothetical protein C7999DRAFT_37839 [Corynascus novoguineensis]|uniref:CinA C-terminal domain-containing protein n=1 Tax=Corynascus novoguineensis TaxID=1126955 RepID=A0AAN7D062_9PEZI|nr:hypothetical protein C7999DRAFT_37839 [Corynascus novoguineensis]
MAPTPPPPSPSQSREHNLRRTESVHELASDVVRLLREAGEAVGAAESLTAGEFMAALAAVPGSSATFRGGIVAYATDLKHSLLSVDADLIGRDGVVDGDVVVQMAEGARRATAAQWGVGTTGVAGPDEQDGKAPGTVYVGIASPRRNGSGRAYGPFMFPGPRESVREATVVEALWRLRDEPVADASGRKE